MIIDLHTHTRIGSDDSFLKPTDLIEQAKKSGLDGVCFTDHDYFWDSDDIAWLCEEHDFLILPGVEINTDDGHILAFGVDKYIYGMHRPEKLRSIIDDAGSVMILSHPYRRHFYMNQDIQEALDRCYQRPFFQHFDIRSTNTGIRDFHFYPIIFFKNGIFDFSELHIIGFIAESL